MRGKRTLVCVMAHPDDDANGIAGTATLHGDDPDFRFVLVHATDGGAGEIREGLESFRVVDVVRVADEMVQVVIETVAVQQECPDLRDAGATGQAAAVGTAEAFGHGRALTGSQRADNRQL